MPARVDGKAFGTEDFISFDFEAEGSPRVADVGAEAETSAAAVGRSQKRKADERQDDGRSKKEREMARSRRTPWSADVDWSQCRNGADALHRELIAFDDWLAPTMEEHQTRCMVIEMIRRAIKSQWQDAEVHPFGSQETKLYLPQGDLDLVVVSPAMENSRREGALRTMAACLRRHNLATNVQVIARAKVPIIKFVTTYARLKVDISINQTNGLAAASYVNSWLKKWPHIRPLIMVLKHLLMQRGMSEVFSGGLGSYSIIIMVISFLQLHPKVQRGEINPDRNLGIMLLEILELYGKNFGYDNCAISIRGQGGYFSKARRGWKDERRPFMLSIEDPHDPANDISKGSFGIIQVRSTLAGAFDILTAAICQQANEASAEGLSWRPQTAGTTRNSDKQSGKHQRFNVDSDSDSDEEARRALLRDSRYDSGKEDKDANSLLGTILGISNPVVNQRKEMESLYHSGSLQFKLGRPAPSKEPQPARPRPTRPEPPRSTRPEPHRPERAPAPSMHSSSSGVVSIKGASGLTKKTSAPRSISILGLANKRANATVISSDDADENTSASSKKPRKFKAAEVIEISSSADEDSRYSASRVSKPTQSSPRKRARHSGMEISQSDLEELSHSAPSNFVSADEESDEDDQRAVRKRTIGTKAVPSNKSNSSVNADTPGVRLKARTKNDFWTAKGVEPHSSTPMTPSPEPAEQVP